MTDTLTKERRSWTMSRIRSKDTKPELLVRKYLFSRGLRFRVNVGRLPGHPDIILTKYNALIEVRGCFWHRHGWEPDGRKIVQRAFCPYATTPKSNRAFWNAKFRRNVLRDAEHERVWAEEGWNVIVVWECGLKTAAEREKTLRFVLRHLEKWAESVASH